jgi:HlyD family secretion protein
LVDKFAAIDTPIEVQVELLPDATSASGYQWSSQAPDITIANGTLCSAQIVVERRRPLSMVLPLLKETMGMN